MPQAVFKSVYSVSSEDATHHPASNLLSIKSGKKWKTKERGEKSAFVILQLESPRKITGIDIGNEHSAFIEVMVGKLGWNVDDFKEILITHSYMTAAESRNSENSNRVRCFGKDVLVESVAGEKWELVKVVCTQPFNRHTQYGLSFVTLHVAGEDTKESGPKNPVISALGGFQLREESPDSDREDLSQSLFQRWRQSKTSSTTTATGIPKMSTAATIRAASSPAALKHGNTSLKPTVIVKDTSSTSNKTKDEEKPFKDRNRDDLFYDKDDDVKNEDLERQISEDRERIRKEKEAVKDSKKNTSIRKESTSTSSKNSSFSVEKSKEDKQKPSASTKESKNHQNKRSQSPPVEIPSKKPKTDEKKVEYRPFGQLLKGVVLVISGIQNPERGNLRQKAIELGAKYKPDWDSSCTHLICAFKNTPKYNQVKGQGKIITKSWIEKCHSLKKRLPWRRYAMDGKEVQKPESEDEIFDVSLKPKLQTPPASPEPSTSTSAVIHQARLRSPVVCESESEELDTDDELERVRKKQNEQKLVGKMEDDEETIEIVENKVEIVENDDKLIEKDENFEKSPTENPKNQPKNGPVSVFDVSTEEEDEVLSHRSDKDEKFLTDKIFYIHNLDKILEVKLKDSIKRYGGILAAKLKDADYVLSKEAVEKCSGIVVDPLWITECDSMKCLIPTRRYTINSG